MRNENMMSDNPDKEMRTDNLSNRPNITNKIPNKDTNRYNTITDRHIVPNSHISHKEHIKEDNQKVRPKKTKLSNVHIKQLNSNRPNKPNSNKLTYSKLIRLLNKSLNTDKELSHSSINNVNTVKLSFMSNKDL